MRLRLNSPNRHICSDGIYQIHSQAGKRHGEIADVKGFARRKPGLPKSAVSVKVAPASTPTFVPNCMPPAQWQTRFELPSSASVSNTNNGKSAIVCQIFLHSGNSSSPATESRRSNLHWIDRWVSDRSGISYQIIQD